MKLVRYLLDLIQRERDEVMIQFGDPTLDDVEHGYLSWYRCDNVRRLLRLRGNLYRRFADDTLWRRTTDPVSAVDLERYLRVEKIDRNRPLERDYTAFEYVD